MSACGSYAYGRVYPRKKHWLTMLVHTGLTLATGTGESGVTVKALAVISAALDVRLAEFFRPFREAIKTKGATAQG
jgi:hypothetical protein